MKTLALTVALAFAGAITPALALTAAAAPPRCQGEDATIIGTAGDDELTGTGGDDVIWAGDGTDEIDGNAGDDTICAGDSKEPEYIYGGSGNDAIAGGPGVDKVRSEAGDDTIRLGCGPCGEGNRWYQHAFAGGGADVVYGSDRYDLIRGGTGPDKIFGRGDKDRLIGGKDDDRIVFGTRGGEDAERGGYVIGGNGHDNLLDLDGTAEMTGDGGSDRLRGRGCCTVAGYYRVFKPVVVDLRDGTATGQGTDALIDIGWVYGSYEGDVLLGDGKNNRLDGLPGRDRLDGRGGRDTCASGEEVENCERRPG